MPRPPERRLALGQAIALGALHGPTELLPVSSSAHTALVPWLAGWSYAELDADLRKAFEVALHTGAAAALLVGVRGEGAELGRAVGRRHLTLLLGSLLPPAIAGLALERPIERRLGTPPTIAAGLAAGGLAMAVADALAPRRRRRTDATPTDALLLGLAQALALVPGVSRNAATLTAARLRCFRRPDARALSRDAAVPVIVAATTLKAARLGRRGSPPGIALPLAAGASAAFCSTLVSVRLVDAVERDRSPAGWAAYRVGLAAVVLRRAAARRRA